MANFEIPGYELYELLGRGGMATVYRALHLNLDREVAIKVMDTSLNTDETFSERFIREARISARLVHPNILQIYDVNAYETLNYISMELLEGGDLADCIRGDMKQSAIYLVMKQMTEALDYASTKGYVHRDIKPSNIMLRGDGDNVLADFGIAKAANSGTQMTQTGLMVGTPSYMSPEQAKGIEIDGRSDLYGLAVLCYEMLTKELPYDSDSAVSTAVKHLTEAIPTLPEHLSAYQPFIDKAMAKKADDRFQTGREMYTAFSEVRDQFSDDDVLTPGKEQPARTRSGANSRDDSRTSLSNSRSSLSWDDSTQVSSSPGGSRPYRLSDTSPRERLVSGTRDGQPPPRRRNGSSAGFRIFAALLVAGGMAYGGYTYWQGQQSTTSGNLRESTAELSLAYAALNREDYQKAAIAFRKALQLDSSSAAATKGLEEVDDNYVAAIEKAFANNDLRTAQRLFTDYSLLFSTSSDVERFQTQLQQAQQDQQLQAVQSERIAIFLEKAERAMASGKLFTPAGDNAYAYLDQAKALQSNNLQVNEAFHALMAQALTQVDALIGAGEFVDARDMVSRVRDIDQGYPALVDVQAAIERAEQADHERQERWSTYSEEQRQQILDRLAAAETLLASGKLTSVEEEEPGVNAQAAFQAVLELDPENQVAKRGSERIVRAYVILSEEAVAQAQFDQADALLDSGAAILADSRDLKQQRKAVSSARKAHAKRAADLEQVNALMAEADGEISRLSEGAVFADRAASLYQQVLALDAANVAAAGALDNLAQFYAGDATNAVEQGQFSLASSSIDKALNLAPENTDYQQVSAALAEQEVAWLAGQNLSELMASGEQLAAEGNLRGAADKYTTALKLDPANSAAGDALENTIAALVARANERLAAGDFNAARDDLAAVTVLVPERQDIPELLAQLPELEQTWNAQQNVSVALGEAQALYDKRQLSNAAAAFDELVRQYPDSSEASEGLSRSLAGLVAYARKSADSGQFDQASTALATVVGLAPNDKAARKLEAELPALEQTYLQQQVAKSKAMEEAMVVADSGFTALDSGDLDGAAGAYQTLSQSHPKLKETSRLKQQLVTAYADSTRAGIDSGEFDQAETYLQAGRQLSPGYSGWDELAEEIAVSRNSSRRRLGAY